MIDISLQATTVATIVNPDVTTATTLANNEDITARTTPEVTSPDATTALVISTTNSTKPVQYTMTATFDLVWSSAYNDPQSEEYRNLTERYNTIAAACFEFLGYTNYTISQPVFKSGSVIAIGDTNVVGARDAVELDGQLKEIVSTEAIPEVVGANLVALEIIEEDTQTTQAYETTTVVVSSNSTSQEEENDTTASEEIITPQMIILEENKTTTSPVLVGGEQTTEDLFSLLDSTTPSGSSSLNTFVYSHIFHLFIASIVIYHAT